MRIFTVIPARGGSKSIPKKNIRLLNGKPLLQYSVEYSLKCDLVEKTIVSTDSNEIAEVAKSCGAEVPFIRPPELARDNTPDYPVFKHALEYLEEEYSVNIDLITLLRPTSPLRPPGLIERGVELFDKHPDSTSIRSVTLTSEHPYRQWIQNGDYIKGLIENIHEPYNLERQELPVVYFQSGDIEIIKRQTLIDGSISGNKVSPLIINHQEMYDIDYEHDLRRAEERLKKNK